jgi:hypothetical protein
LCCSATLDIVTVKTDESKIECTSNDGGVKNE